MFKKTIIGFLSLILSLSLMSCGTSTKTPKPDRLLTKMSNNKMSKETELQIIDIKQGNGPMAEKGQEVRVHYTGTIYPSGEKFDSSLDRGQPFVFKLGAGRVIKGWEEGIVGMKTGGKRTLIVPPSMGYGEHGFPPVIPPNATLKFEVNLLGIE